MVTFPFLSALLFILLLLASHRIVFRFYRSAVQQWPSEPSSEQTFCRHFLSFCHTEKEKEKERERYNATLSLLVHFFLPSFLPGLVLATRSAAAASRGRGPSPGPGEGAGEYGRAESTPYVIAICNSILSLSLSNLESPARARSRSERRTAASHSVPRSTHTTYTCNVAFTSD